MSETSYSVEFYEARSGDKPALRWIREDLSVRQRRALGYGMQRLLQRYGVGVCGTEYSRQLGGGLLEFRLRLSAASDGEHALLRLFCHATDDRVVLVLGGYDKARSPGARRQSAEIARARRRLSAHRSRRRGGESDAPQSA